MNANLLNRITVEAGKCGGKAEAPTQSMALSANLPFRACWGRATITQKSALAGRQ
ncbi:hypothetical protein MASR1M60_25600 [Rhodocyclaceae bacterium]